MCCAVGHASIVIIVKLIKNKAMEVLIGIVVVFVIVSTVFLGYVSWRRDKVINGKIVTIS